MDREVGRDPVAPGEPVLRRKARPRRQTVPAAKSAGRQVPAPFRGVKPPLAAGMSVDEALQALLPAALSHFLENRPSVLAGDPEGVHQMRIGLRRLRSTLSTFRPAIARPSLEPLMGEARTLFAALGAVRETDVFLLETLPEAEAEGLPARAALGARRAVENCRKTSFAALTAHLRGPAFQQFASDLRDWIESKGWRDDTDPMLELRQSMRIEEFLGPRLDRAYGRVLKRARRARHGSQNDWHQVRIAIKRVRYVSEQLADVYGEGAARFAKKLQRLQENLGHLNDLATIDSVLERASSEGGARERPAVGEARLFLSGWRAGQEKALARDLSEDGRKLRRTSGFW